MPRPKIFRHIDLSNAEVFRMIHQGKLAWAGNAKLKIYGRLKCVSGRRMKRENRVFFEREADALDLGYRPCGRCMPQEYKVWKTGSEK